MKWLGGFPAWGRPDAVTATAMAGAGLMIAQMVAAKALRDSVFLTAFPATALPTMTIAAATFAILASYTGTRMLRALSPAKVVPAAFMLSALAQVAERSLFLAMPRAAACVIFLHVFAINLVLTSAFWSLMNEHFDPRSAQKAFGRIAGMGTVGGILGGLLAERVAAWGSVQVLILATAALHFACGMTLWRFTRNYVSAHHVEPESKQAVRSALRKSPYLLELAALIVTVSIAAGLVDYLFKSQAAAAIGKGPSLTRFFAWFYTGTSLLSAVLQTFAAPVMLARLGLATTVTSLPLTVAAGGAGALAFFGLAEITMLRGLEVVLRGSLFRSGYELFYTPVASAEKRAVKGIIDVAGERLGDALSSGFVALLLFLHWSGKGTILGTAIVFACVGLWLAKRLERAYVRALETSLAHHTKRMEPEDETDELANSVVVPASQLIPADAAPADNASHTVMVLRDHPIVRQLVELNSKEENRVVHALMKINTPDPLICQQLIRLLNNDAYAFFAMEKLRRVASRNVGLLADALLDRQEEFSIRRRIPLILTASRAQRALDALIEALEDPEFQIRFRSAHAIGQLRVDRPEMYFRADRVWAALASELQVSREDWERRRLVAAGGAGGDSSAVESPGEASVEYLFALLGLLLPREPVAMAYRALGTTDRHLRGTALEYLQTVLPTPTWKLLEKLIAERMTAPIARPGA